MPRTPPGPRPARPRSHLRQASAIAALGALAILANPPVVSSTAGAQEIRTAASVEGITEYRLDNGLRVLLFPDPSKPQVTVNITYFVGSRHESYGETGMAHLLEHLLFKGTPDHPDISQELTERGARPNGTTWYDRTNYYETFPATEDNLRWALDLEADRMIHSFVSAEDLESEMTVVRNEMEAGENSPLNILLERTLSTAYLWHNYGKSTIGARADVENVPVERLQRFYRKYYQPDNAMLVVAGRFDEERALATIRETFGSIPRPERTGADRIWPTYTREPTQDGERSVTLRRVGDEQLLMIAYHVPPGSHGDFAAIDLLTHVLGDDPTGRIHRALVEEGLAADASAFNLQLKEAGPLVAYARLRPGQDLDPAQEALETLLAEVVDGRPVTDPEVERARTALLKEVELSFTDSERIALSLSEWAAMGDWRLFFLHRDRLAQTTPEDVNRVARAYLKPSNRTVGRFLPTADPDRAEIPAPPEVEALVADYRGRENVAAGEAFDPSPGNVDARTVTFSLPNGFEVALLPKSTRGEVVHGFLRLHFGDRESLWGRTAEGDLAGGMLMRGTERLSRRELSDEIDRLGARISLNGGATLTTGQLETTRESLAGVVKLVAEVARTPRFDAGEFEVMREERLAALESRRSEPSALARIALSRHMDPHPEGHPNRTPTLDEEIEAVEGVTLEGARRFHREFYGPQSGILVLVGDFEVETTRAVIEGAFGDWEGAHSFARIPGEARRVPAEEIVIETPDRANAFLLSQQNLRLRDTDPDYPALVLAGYMLGGGFLNSRLARRIRQEEGLSYGVGAAISGHPVDPDGRFFAYAICAPENVGAVEAAFREELAKVVDGGFRAEELEAAKRGWLESRQLGRADDRALAGTLASNLYFDRTMAWDAALEEAVRTLTVEEVNRAVRSRLDPEELTVVKAGDFAGAQERAPAEGRRGSEDGDPGPR